MYINVDATDANTELKYMVPDHLLKLTVYIHNIQDTANSEIIKDRIESIYANRGNTSKIWGTIISQNALSHK